MTILQPRKRIVLIGDSHMEALGPRLTRSLPRLGVSVLGATANRGKSAHWYVAQGIVPALTRGADVVIFELGGNDASQHRTATEHKRDVATLIQQARPAEVIWIGPGVTTRADLEAYRHPIRGAQKSVVSGAKGAWIDSQPLTRIADRRRSLHRGGIRSMGRPSSAQTCVGNGCQSVAGVVWAGGLCGACRRWRMATLQTSPR